MSVFGVVTQRSFLRDSGPRQKLEKGQGGKTADWLLISRVILLSADLSATAQQSLKNCEFFTSVTQQIQPEMQK